MGTNNIDTVTHEGKVFPFEEWVTLKYKDTLKDLLEDPTNAFYIFIDGLPDPITFPNPMDGRVVAEGYIVPKGFFFWETSWNTGENLAAPCGHFIDGTIRDPKWVDGMGVVWVFGGAALVLYSLENKNLQDYRKRMDNGWGTDPKRSREAGRTQALKIVAMSSPY